MNKTAIDWAEMTFNPVTGCLGPDGKPCIYCYARKIARRFSGAGYPLCGDDFLGHELVELDEPYIWSDEYGEKHRIAYPADFTPTLHKYRLDEPAKLKKPSTIFVCSMADLFGDWVPDSWIHQVFDACVAAPQHRYLFLTKNPKRYISLKDMIPKTKNIWLGTTATDWEADIFYDNGCTGIGGAFISAEPLMGGIYKRIDDGLYSGIDWVIVGAETGNRKGKVIPDREWLVDIARACWAACIPLYMKNSLRDIWGKPLIQEFPWKVANSG